MLLSSVDTNFLSCRTFQKIFLKNDKPVKIRPECFLSINVLTLHFVSSCFFPRSTMDRRDWKYAISPVEN